MHLSLFWKWRPHIEEDSQAVQRGRQCPRILREHREGPRWGFRLTARNFDQKYWTVHFTSTQYTFFGKKFEFLTHLNILLWWGENSSYRQSKPSPNYFRKWIIWANSKIWQTYFGRFPEILSWETMRTCLNGYWMGNRRPTNTHILRSALRNSQTKKMLSTMQGTGEMVLRIWGTKGRSRRASCVCALRMRDAFPGNNRDKSRCAEPRIPRTCLWGYWMGSDKRKHPRLMSHFSVHNHLDLCLLEISQIFSGFMQA